MATIESTGEKFSLTTYLQARDLCIQTTKKIIEQIGAGMNQAEVKELIDTEFKKIGVTKFWHPTKIRFASDTTKSFRDLTDLNLKTEENELCFLDLGPIIEDHEADFGRTFRVKSELTHPLIEASQSIFSQTSKAWRNGQLSGIEIFKFAECLATDLGYLLNPKMAGHRLGDFPHQVFSSQKLFEFEKQPIANLWVLEIHLVDEKLNRGAFFEDILQ